jgi:hypothetical protein
VWSSILHAVTLNDSFKPMILRGTAQFRCWPLMRLILSVLFVLMSGTVVAQHPPPLPASREIEQLFVALNQSNCQFYRNGSWHEAAEAGAHLRRKYEYLLKRGLVSSAETFIDRAASKSSMSGKPYLVKCGNDAPVESKQWFIGKLRELRDR